MTVTINGTSGITTPAVTNDGAYTGDGISFADGTPSNTLVTTTGGNVGIGTSSPSSLGLSIAKTAGTATGISLYQTSTEVFRLATDNAAIYVQGRTGLPMQFYTNETERMRITSSGDLLIGTTTDTDQRVRITYNGTTPGWGMKVHSTATSGDNKFIEFGTEAGFTARGSITYNRGAGTVAYNTTSDSRLKDNIESAPSALYKINSVQIRSYDWKETGNHVDFGVIAQELIQVAPEAVTEGTDNEDGTIKSPWSVDTAALVPAMIKAIQEQQAIISDLKARIETLEQSNGS